MGYSLPNGAHIYTDSLEAIEEFHRKVMALSDINTCETKLAA